MPWPVGWLRRDWLGSSEGMTRPGSGGDVDRRAVRACACGPGHPPQVKLTTEAVASENSEEGLAGSREQPAHTHAFCRVTAARPLTGGRGATPTAPESGLAWRLAQPIDATEMAVCSSEPQDTCSPRSALTPDSTLRTSQLPAGGDRHVTCAPVPC